MKLILGDCLNVLKNLETNSIDALVTDPPAGISFMNKEWDSNKGGRDQWIEWFSIVMSECLRVLKPGAHGLVWSIPRTSHWTAMALELAGFEVRDCVSHLFGSGFPKSLNISKAIDKEAGAERKVIGPSNRHGGGINNIYGDGMGDGEKTVITAPATDAAKQWDGFGTALKPAVEMWWLVRKPISEKTVAKNVLKWGVGGLNIDGCRVDGKPRTTHKDGNFQSKTDKSGKIFDGLGLGYECPIPQGRFPANLILDEEAARLLDEQSIAGGIHSAGKGRKKTVTSEYENSSYHAPKTRQMDRFEDSGVGASRFFYVAKASKSERGKENNHPTVKSTKLMSYLCKLITPPNGIILDPFMGSGSTGVAAKKEGFNFIGIEQEKEYFEIAKKRFGIE